MTNNTRTKRPWERDSTQMYELTYGRVPKDRDDLMDMINDRLSSTTHDPTLTEVNDDHTTSSE